MTPESNFIVADGTEGLWLCTTEDFNPDPAGPLFTKRTDVLLQNLVKSRSSEIGCYSDRVALKFGRHLHSAAADVHVNFQSDLESLNLNLAASRLHDILRRDVHPLSE